MHKQINIPNGAEQWLINLIELYNRSGKSFKQIAESENIAEKSVSNVFLGKAKSPGVDLVCKIIHALGGHRNEIFCESGAIIGGQDLATLQAEVERLTEENATLKAENDLAHAELDILRKKTTLQEAELDLFKERLQHKDELLALVKYIIKTRPTE